MPHADFTVLIRAAPAESLQIADNAVDLNTRAPGVDLALWFRLYC